jgi:uncharacterized membrane protein YtjA (UPF0391 family)
LIKVRFICARASLVGEDVMLKWSLVFFLLAVASGVLGVVDNNLTTAVMAQVFFFGNVVLFVVFTLLGSIAVQAVDSPIEHPRRDR